MAMGDMFANQFTPDFVIQGWTSLRGLMRYLFNLSNRLVYDMRTYIGENICIVDHVFMRETVKNIHGVDIDQNLQLPS